MQSLFFQGVLALLPLATGLTLAPHDGHDVDIESLAGVHQTPDAIKAAGGSPPHEMASVQGALASLLKSGAGAEGSNNSVLVTTILDIVNVTMRNKLLAAHNNSLTKIAAASGEIDACMSAYQAADHTRFPPSELSLLQEHNWEKEEIEEYFEAYSWCKQYEQNQSVSFSACEYHCQNETVPGQECVDIGEDCDPLDCAPVAHEGYRAYLTRMVDSFESLLEYNANWTFHQHNDSKCREIPKIVHRCYEKCDGQIAAIKPQNETMPGPCCAPRASAETETCNTLTKRRTAWENYDACYDAATSNWDTVKAEHEAEGLSRAAQMRSILRMVCLISSFGPDQKTKLKACMEKSYVQDPAVLAMKIDAGEATSFHDKLSVFSCNMSEVPGTEEFDAIHYGNLPKGLTACPAVSCEDACGLSSSSEVWEEVEVCAPLEEWQSSPIDSPMGWSKMGTAYALGAGVTCESAFFWGVGEGSCSYAKCPEKSVRNVEDVGPNITNPSKGPGTCPCKTKMHRRVESSKISQMTTVDSTCFLGKAETSAVYWDLGASQPLGKVAAEVNPGTHDLEVFITDKEPGSELPATDSCGKITGKTSADCVSHSGGRFLVLKASSGPCMMGDCKPSWCNMKVEGVAMKQEPMAATGSLYVGQVLASETK